MESIVIIATYNEKENIEKLAEEILQLKEDIHIIIIDDNSPDGTGQLADELAYKYIEIEVIHREKKLGLGSAYVQGFKHALEKRAKYIFTMDADFSHNPRSIPDFLSAIQDCDLVIGSRYLGGIRVLNWGFGRLIISKMATFYVKMTTGLPFTDITGGFNCYKRRLFESIALEKICSNGYSFQIEIKYKAYIKGFKIVEIPIVFEERRVGQSKLSKRIIWEAFWIVWRLQFETLWEKFGSQFIKFTIVGTVGFLVNMAVFYITNRILNLNYNFCAIISFLAAVSNNFFLNKIWTFKDFEKDRLFIKFFRYLVANILGFGCNLLVLNILSRNFGVDILFSQAVGVLIGMGVNFIGSKRWVFNSI